MVCTTTDLPATSPPDVLSQGCILQAPGSQTRLKSPVEDLALRTLIYPNTCVVERKSEGGLRRFGKRLEFVGAPVYLMSGGAVAEHHGRVVPPGQNGVKPGRGSRPNTRLWAKGMR
jgi:hypothetical protein